MKAVVAAFNQEKALVGAFSVIMNLRMELFEALRPPVSVTRLVTGWRTAACLVTARHSGAASAGSPAAAAWSSCATSGGPG